MPQKPKRPCKQQGCPNTIRKGQYCEKHKYLQKKRVYKRKPDTRPSAWKRGYNSEFYEIRKKLLKEHPICQTCNKRYATIAHHIPDYIPGTSHYQYAYKALCHGCHERTKK